MRAKEYLQQIRKLDAAINQKIKELGDLRSKARSLGSIDYSNERVKKSSSGNVSFEKTLDKVIDLEKEINRKTDSFIDEKHRIIDQIQSLQNAYHVELLYKRYVEYKNLKHISFEMNFSYDYIKHLHRTALKDFDNKILNSTPDNTFTML